MSEIKLICHYCNHSWTKQIAYFSNLDELKCEKCNDKNVEQVKESAKGDIFGYGYTTKEKLK